MENRKTALLTKTLNALQTVYEGYCLFCLGSLTAMIAVAELPLVAPAMLRCLWRYGWSNRDRAYQEASLLTQRQDAFCALVMINMWIWALTNLGIRNMSAAAAEFRVLRQIYEQKAAASKPGREGLPRNLCSTCRPEV